MENVAERTDADDALLDAVKIINGAGLLDEKRLRQLALLAQIRHLKRGELLVREGRVSTSVDFLLRGGVIRSFRLDANGSDLTDCFVIKPGDPVVASPELDAPALASIEVLSDVDLLSFDSRELSHVVMNDLALSRWYIVLLQQAWRRHWDVKCALQQLDMSGRYEWFLQAYPGLIDLVPHRFVASFLGMTTVSLSRVRARRKSK